jgi:hypothetical protein
MEQKTESLIELKARAYDATVQIKAWQKILDDIQLSIKHCVEQSQIENVNGTKDPVDLKQQ